MSQVADAAVFSALGDRTRLRIIGRLAGGCPRTITELSRNASITRQAVTKHLRVLRGAGLVSEARQGRETFYALEPESVTAARRRLELVSAQWDGALSRLKALVEGPAS